MTIFQSAAAAVCSCLDSLAAGAAAATAGRFYKEKHLAACYSCLNWGKKIALYWLRRCLNYVLSAATAAASAIIYTKRNLWMRSDFYLRRHLDSLILKFSLSDLWQNFDRLHSFRCVTDFIMDPWNDQPSLPCDISPIPQSPQRPIIDIMFWSMAKKSPVLGHFWAESRWDRRPIFIFFHDKYCEV